MKIESTKKEHVKDVFQVRPRCGQAMQRTRIGNRIARVN